MTGDACEGVIPVATIIDEAGIELTLDSSGFAARLRAEVEQALAEATRGAGNTVNINVTGDDFDDARMRQKIRQFEVYVNQVRTRQREQDRRYFLLLNQRINQTFNRIKLRINQLKAQLATLKNQKIEIDLDLNEDRIRERLAELARNRDLTLNVDVDLAKARAEIDAFRAEQEANAITIPVRLDEEKLKRYSRTLGETTTGTTGLTRATEGLNRTLGDSEAAAARVTALEERLTDARAKSEAATAKRSAAEEALSRAEENHERTGAALEQAEARLASLRQRTTGDTQLLEKAETDAAKAREQHSVATERYFTAESKATTAKNAAERASRGLATAERDHESALTRLREIEQRSDEGGERRVGLFRRLTSGVGDLVRNMFSLGGSTSEAGSGLTSLGSSVTGLTSKIGGAGGGLVGSMTSLGSSVVTLGAQISGFLAIAGAVTFAVGGLTAAVLAAPAAITGLAAAVGVGALAFQNFGDAIKEANTPEELKKQQEAMAKLHPEAQKVARIFNNELRPAFEGFQKEIQGRFFQGLDEPFRKLVQTINGALKPGLLAVTGSVNAFVKQLLGIVTGEEGVRRVNNALSAAKSFLDQLLPAVGNLVRSFLDLAGVEPIARAIGGAFGDVLNQVSAFFDEMRRSGEAQAAVEALRGVVSTLSGTFLDILRSATNFFTQAAPGFNSLVTAAGNLATTLIDDLGGAFNTALQAAADFINNIPPESIDAFKNAVADLSRAFMDFANSEWPRIIVDGVTAIIEGFTHFVDIVTAIGPAIEGLLDDFEFLIDVLGLVAKAVGFLGDPNAAIDRLLGTMRNADGSIQSFGNSAEGVEKSLGQFKTGTDDAGASVDSFRNKLKGTADAAPPLANAIVNGVVTPLKNLPKLSQAEFDKLPSGVRQALGQAATDGGRGAQELARKTGEPMSQIPGLTQKAFAGLDRIVQDSLLRAKDVARPAAEGIVNGVKLPISALPTLTQAEFNKLPKIVQDQLTQASQAANRGAPPIPEGVRGPMSQVPGITEEAFGKLDKTVQDSLIKASDAARAGAGKLPDAVGAEAGKVPGVLDKALASAPGIAAGKANAIVNGVRVPIQLLPSLTQEQFSQLPQIVQTQLGQASVAAARGAAPLPDNVKGPMSQVPGITQAEFAKLKPEIQKQLTDAAAVAKAGADLIPKNLGTSLAPAPGEAGKALAPTTPEVQKQLDPAAQKAKEVGDQIVEQLRGSLRGATDAARESLAPLSDAIRTTLDGATSQATQSSIRVVQAIRTELSKAPQVATEAFAGYTAAIIAALEPSVTQAGASGRRIVEALRVELARVPQVAEQALGRGLVDAVTKACADAERAMRDGVTAITTAANFAGIATSAETELAKIPTSVQTHLTAASAGVTQIGGAMVTSWQTNMAQLPVITNDTWAQVVRIITEQGRQAQTNAQTVADAILQVFLNLGQPMYVAGYNMMLRLAAGIQQGGQQAIIAAQNVARQIQGLFPQSPPKWGPLSGEGDTLKSGGRIGQRLAAGMENEADAVARAASTLAARVSGSLDGASPGQRAAAVSASSTARSASAVSASSSPAAAGPSAAEMYAATKAGTEAAMAGMKVELKGDLVQFVSDGQRRDDRRAGRRSVR